jgi:hypothetical protein
MVSASAGNMLASPAGCLLCLFEELEGVVRQGTAATTGSFTFIFMAAAAAATTTSGLWEAMRLSEEFISYPRLSNMWVKHSHCCDIPRDY